MLFSWSELAFLEYSFCFSCFLWLFLSYWFHRATFTECSTKKTGWQITETAIHDSGYLIIVSIFNCFVGFVSCTEHAFHLNSILLEPATARLTYMLSSDTDDWQKLRKYHQKYIKLHFHTLSALSENNATKTLTSFKIDATIPSKFSDCLKRIKQPHGLPLLNNVAIKPHFSISGFQHLIAKNALIFIPLSENANDWQHLQRKI